MIRFNLDLPKVLRILWKLNRGHHAKKNCTRRFQPSRTYVHFAGSESIVKMLIEHGADVNAVNNYNNTALLLAINSGNEELVEFMHHMV